MRICFVGNADSIHIAKLCRWFVQREHEVSVISFMNADIPGVEVYVIDPSVDADGGDMGKLRYLFCGRRIRQFVNHIKPDVVSVHYASSYGVAVALSGIKDYILSVWGSDIYQFPNKSFAHRALLKYSLKRAGRLLSTSRAMAKETAKYTDRPIEITPFGIDTLQFSPDKRTRVSTDMDCFVVGIVKGLYDFYGIDLLLEAVAAIRKEGEIPVRLRIAGKGVDEGKLRELARTLGIDDITTWLGYIDQETAAREWADMDVAVVPSRSESFGVAAIEAQGCGTAIIISDVPGLMEVAKPDETCIVVRKDNSEDIKNAIKELYHDPAKRLKMGVNAREFVVKNYEMNSCFEAIESIFRDQEGLKS